MNIPGFGSTAIICLVKYLFLCKSPASNFLDSHFAEITIQSAVPSGQVLPASRQSLSEPYFYPVFLILSNNSAASHRIQKLPKCRLDLDSIHIRKERLEKRFIF